MTTTEIVTLSVYVVGALVFIYTAYIQKAQIDKLKSTNENVERFMNIIKVDKLEEYVKLREKSLDLKHENWIQEYAKEATDKLMKHNFKPIIDEHLEKFKVTINDQMNELGYFAVDLLLALPEADREKLLQRDFPKSRDLLQIHIDAQLKWEREHPEENSDEDSEPTK